MKWMMTGQSIRQVLLSLLLATGWVTAAAGLIQASPRGPDELLRQAKLAIFDERWEEALQLLAELQTCCPSSPQAPSARFYQARVLDNMGRRAEALEQYDRFVHSDARSAALEKEARLAIVKLSARLWTEGQRQFIGNVTRALTDSDMDLRLLAAIQLSYLESRELRQRAVPVLRQVLRESSDTEVQNQATLALLRIDPKLLQTGSAGERPKESKKIQRLHISVKSGANETFSLTLPASLVRLVFSSLPEEAKRDLAAKGIDAGNILDQLREAGEILEIKGDSETLRLWVE